MKLKRAKAYKKLMIYLQLNFNFHEPYQVLVDEEIVLNAVASKYDLVAGLERTLQGKVKVMITQCTIEHLYRAKTPEGKQAVALAKTFERRRCGHVPQNDQTLSAFECIKEVVGPTNKHRYAIATQKPKLRAILRQVVAVPIVYISRSVMILEPMSGATKNARKNMEESKLTQGLNKVDTDNEEASQNGETPHKKKTGPKGPNPLSVKKRQRPEDESKSSGDGDGKKRRKRGKKKESNEEGASTEPAAEESE